MFCKENEIANEVLAFSRRCSFNLKINLEIIDFLIGNEQFQLINSLVQSLVILDLYPMDEIEKMR